MTDSKRKGSGWERDAVKLLHRFLGGVWKRIPGSGALGHHFKEAMLFGDILGTLEHFNAKSFKLDAKVGYGGHKQLTIQKEWIEKIREEADASNCIPGLICKFSGARGDTRYFFVLDFDAFVELMGMADEASKLLNEAYYTISDMEKTHGNSLGQD